MTSDTDRGESPSSTHRSLDDEHPLCASWMDIMQPHGHGARASSAWIKAFVSSRLASGDDPSMIGALAAASVNMRFAHGTAIFERACELDPRAADCLRQGALSKEAFQKADLACSLAARQWGIPARRGWAKALRDEAVLADAKKFFGAMGERCMKLADSNAFEETASGAGLMAKPDGRHGYPRAEQIGRSGSRVKLICAALQAGATPPESWLRPWARADILARAFPMHQPSICMALARALHACPHERGEAIGKAHLACVEIFERDNKASMGSAYAAMRDPLSAEWAEQYQRGRARSMGAALAHGLSRSEPLDFGIDQESIWKALLPMDWSSPERDERALRIFQPLEQCPLKYVEAVRLMGEAGSRYGWCEPGMSPRIASKSWKFLASERPDLRFPMLFQSMAAGHPDAHGQRKALEKCSAPMRAKIEAAMIATSIPVSGALTGMGRPRI